MMSPKGAAFLYVKKVHQSWVDPLLISWGYQSDTPSHSQFIDYHETTGTRDFSAFLAVPSAIDFMDQHDWDSKRLMCQQKTIYWAERLKSTFGFEPIAPIDCSFIGQMFSMPIKTNDLAALKEALFNRFGIEVPVFLNHQHAFIRFSYQVFNSDKDMEGLVKSLKVLQKEKYFSLH
jgi:isopenicillin-N epimerase